MNWKSWPYWVRGIIGGLAAFVLLLGINSVWNEPDWYVALLEFIMYIPSKLMELTAPLFCTPPPDPFLECFGTEMATVGIFLLIEFLAFGAVIGYLYGKFKNRRIAKIT